MGGNCRGSQEAPGRGFQWCNSSLRLIQSLTSPDLRRQSGSNTSRTSGRWSSRGRGMFFILPLRIRAEAYFAGSRTSGELVFIDESSMRLRPILNLARPQSHAPLQRSEKQCVGVQFSVRGEFPNFTKCAAAPTRRLVVSDEALIYDGGAYRFGQVQRSVERATGRPAHHSERFR